MHTHTPATFPHHHYLHLPFWCFATHTMGLPRFPGSPHWAETMPGACTLYPHYKAAYYTTYLLFFCIVFQFPSVLFFCYPTTVFSFCRFVLLTCHILHHFPCVPHVHTIFTPASHAAVVSTTFWGLVSFTLHSYHPFTILLS